MPKITSEKKHINQKENAPEFCIKNVLAYSKAVCFKTLDSGTKIKLVLN